MFANAVKKLMPSVTGVLGTRLIENDPEKGVQRQHPFGRASLSQMLGLALQHCTLSKQSRKKDTTTDSLGIPGLADFEKLNCASVRAT
jgi:hypothetical protein